MSSGASPLSRREVRIGGGGALDSFFGCERAFLRGGGSSLYSPMVNALKQANVMSSSFLPCNLKWERSVHYRLQDQVPPGVFYSLQ